VWGDRMAQPGGVVKFDGQTPCRGAGGALERRVKGARVRRHAPGSFERPGRRSGGRALSGMTMSKIASVRLTSRAIDRGASP
jgi:hypothetical protein